MTTDIELELDLARNVLGTLDEDVRRRIRAVIETPNVETWEDAHCIILNWATAKESTLWQGVCAVDPTFPRRGRLTDIKGRVLEEWRQIPSQETLLAAMRYLTH